MWPTSNRIGSSYIVEGICFRILRLRLGPYRKSETGSRKAVFVEHFTGLRKWNLEKVTQKAQKKLFLRKPVTFSGKRNRKRNRTVGYGCFCF